LSQVILTGALPSLQSLSVNGHFPGEPALAST